MSNEQEARGAIIWWAKQYYRPEVEDPTPEIEIISIKREDEADTNPLANWEVELAVSTSADNPHITFWLDGHHRVLDNAIHIESIEY